MHTNIQKRYRHLQKVRTERLKQVALASTEKKPIKEKEIHGSDRGLIGYCTSSEDIKTTRK